MRPLRIIRQSKLKPTVCKLPGRAEFASRKQKLPIDLVRVTEFKAVRLVFAYWRALRQSSSNHGDLLHRRLEADHIDLPRGRIAPKQGQTKLILTKSEHAELNAGRFGLLPTLVEGKRIPQAIRKLSLTSDQFHGE